MLLKDCEDVKRAYSCKQIRGMCGGMEEDAKIQKLILSQSTTTENVFMYVYRTQETA